MELWLDGIDRRAVEHTKKIGLLSGITTNPSILSHPNRPVEDLLDELLSLFSGPIAVQVTERGANEMVDQGKDLFDFSPRIVVKVPVTEEGIEAISRLTHHDIPTMGTTIITPLQAYLAAKAGARYLAPYFSHMGEKALEMVHSIQEAVARFHFKTKVCVASLKTPQDVEQCLTIGVKAVTLKPHLFNQCLTPPKQVFEHLNHFEENWRHAAPSNLLATHPILR